MKFVEIELTNGDKVFINFDLIISFSDITKEGYTKVYSVDTPKGNSEAYWKVKGTPAELYYRLGKFQRLSFLVGE